ncbi:MAG: SseB family protein [Pseudomonadota bacterium]
MIWKRLFGKKDTVSERHGDSVIEYTPKKGAPSSDQSIPEWTPVNALEEQMAQIPRSVEAQFGFARLLLESDVLLATAKPATSQGPRTLESDEDFEVVCVANTRGGSSAAMFTSEIRLREAFGPEAPFVALNGRAALQSIAGTGVMINAGSEGLWTFYDTPTIERILSGKI